MTVSWALESRLAKEKGEEMNERDDAGERIVAELIDLGIFSFEGPWSCANRRTRLVGKWEA